MSEPTYGACGVCGQPFDPFDPPPTFRNVQVGTTEDGKPIMQPQLSKPMRMDPVTGACCWCPQPPRPIDPTPCRCGHRRDEHSYDAPITSCMFADGVSVCLCVVFWAESEWAASQAGRETRP